jgi:two-component system, response regulator PdtaR
MFSTAPMVPPLLDIDSILATRSPPFDDDPNERSERKTDADKRPGSRILVVEDDWFAGTDMQAALQNAGYNVLELVTSANEAIEAAGDYKPDLIIMDVRLVGNRDGVDAALEIGRRFDIRCLFVTAFVDPALRSRAEAARPFGWLTKPISREALVEAVRDALGGG